MTGAAESCKAMCAGFGLVLVLMVVIFVNEQRYVRTMAAIDIFERKAQEVYDCRGSNENNNKLVYVGGCEVHLPEATTFLPSPWKEYFPPDYTAQEVSVKIEIKQWHRKCETVKDKHGDTHRECNDELAWFSSPQPDTRDHQNYAQNDLPDGLHLGSFTWSTTKVVTLSGTDSEPGFTLPSALSLPTEDAVEVATPPGFYVDGGGYATLGGEDVGAYRVSVTASRADLANVGAQQTRGRGGYTFEAYPPQQYNIFGMTTTEFERATFNREMSKTEFENDYRSETNMIVTVFRLVGFFGMIAAFNCIFTPLSSAADLLKYLDYVTCCLGSILDGAVQAVISAVSCCSACFCFTLIFTISWFMARPWYGILGFVIMAGLGGGAFAYRTQLAKSAKARSFVAVEPLESCAYTKVVV